MAISVGNNYPFITVMHCIVLLIIGVLNFISASPQNIVLGILDIIAAIVGIYTAWKGDKRTIIIYLVLVFIILAYSVVTFVLSLLSVAILGMLFALLNAIFMCSCFYFGWKFYQSISGGAAK